MRDETLPAPPVPVECNLQGLPFMPLLVDRLRRSKAWLRAKRQPELGFFMINLWAHSWHEVPAASLEDDDDALADAAMCDPGRWSKIRDKALHGFIKCDDGRLYHPVVAEQALKAWQERVGYQERLAKARAAKEAKKGSGKGAPIETGKAVVAGDATGATTDQMTGSVIGGATGLKGTETETGRGRVPLTPTPIEPVQIIRALDDAIAAAWGEAQRRPFPNGGDIVTARRWLDDGATVELCSDVFQGQCAAMAGKGRQPPRSLKFFDDDVRITMAENAKAPQLPSPAGNGHGANGSTASDEVIQWRARVSGLEKHGTWLSDWGPRPGEPGCLVPTEALP